VVDSTITIEKTAAKIRYVQLSYLWSIASPSSEQALMSSTPAVASSTLRVVRLHRRRPKDPRLLRRPLLRSRRNVIARLLIVCISRFGRHGLFIMKVKTIDSTVITHHSDGSANQPVKPDAKQKYNALCGHGMYTFCCGGLNYSSHHWLIAGCRYEQLPPDYLFPPPSWDSLLLYLMNFSIMAQH
jgi:hypothetical protein